jgi:hypothetical protein
MGEGCVVLFNARACACVRACACACMCARVCAGACAVLVNPVAHGEDCANPRTGQKGLTEEPDRRDAVLTDRLTIG